MNKPPAKPVVLILQKNFVIIIVVGKEKGFAWGDKPPITTIGGENNFYPENIPLSFGQHLLKCNKDFVSIIQGIEVVYLFL